MSMSKLNWPEAFKTGVIAFLYLSVCGIIAVIILTIRDIITESITGDLGLILSILFFVVAALISGIVGLASFIKVTTASIHKLEWPQAFKAGVIAFLYLCLWSLFYNFILILGGITDTIIDILMTTGIFVDIIESVAVTIKRILSYYNDLILIIAGILIIIAVLTSTIKVTIESTRNKVRWREAFVPAVTAFLYFLGWGIFAYMILLFADITITTMGGIVGGLLLIDDLPGSILITDLITLLFIAVVSVTAILGLASTIKIITDTLVSFEWPTSFVHRKDFKARSVGVLKQYMEVKHGVVGLFLVTAFIIIALIAPIVYPKYPGQLARVGPDYAAPSWMREIVDPEAPEFKNYVPDPSFMDDSSWNMSSVSLMSTFYSIPNDTKGSWEWDYDTYTKGTRSIKLTITENGSTPLFTRHKTSVTGLTSFAYNYSMPTWVTLKFDIKCIYNGSNQNSISPYVQLKNPRSPWPEYLSRAEIDAPFHNEWLTIRRNISLFGYYNVFEKDAMVNVEFGLGWSNPAAHPFRSPPDAEETGTATIWFDNIEVVVHPDFYGLLGTTDAGQDVMAQLMWGTQVSLFIGLVATFIGVTVGLMVGLVAGYSGGYVDEILMRIVDFFLIMPGLPIMMILAALFSPSLEITTTIIALFAWPGPSRVIRSQVLVEKEKSYVEAARAAGAGDVYLIFKHVFPNVLTLVFVQLATGVSGAILAEAGLSFLALTPQELVSWGRMLQAGYNAAALQNNAWWFVVPPGFMIVLLSMGFVFIGYAVDKAMNPRQRRL